MTPLNQEWHFLSLPRLFQDLRTQEEGLQEAEAQARLKRFGPNQLPRQKPTSPGIILLRQFASPLILILALAAVVSVVIGELNDALFIGAVLVINSLIGGYQEWKAEKSNRALEKFLKFTASVFRGAEVREIDAEAVVPGDIVWLEAGFRVPADVRLLQARGLEIDESALTGESLPVTKDRSWQGGAGIPMSDQKNMAWAGTTVVRGRGKGIVVATGSRTAIGQLALDVLAARGGKPPLLLRLEKFTRMVGLAVVAAVLLVGTVGWLQGYTLTEMFFFGVALGVAAVPEGLLVAITVALAIGTARMARRGVIVRQLAVVEGLGSCTYIASDKTGTLTCNELTVKEIRLEDGKVLQVSGEGFIPEGEIQAEGENLSEDQRRNLESLLRVGVLCNEGDLHLRDHRWIWHGDPTDVALLSLGRKGGIGRESLLDAWPQVNEIPFEAERQYAATFHHQDGKVRVMVKGAPERLMQMMGPAADPEERSRWEERALEMTRQGYRVLALGEETLPLALRPEENPPEPGAIRIRGLVGMIDPLRPGARDAVKACQGAGVRVAMVTGDHPETALAIAKELGLAERMDQVVTGTELKVGNKNQLPDLVAQARVFSRVLPHEKFQIVRAAQAHGDFVAVTGDGVNDAPALREANIGVAMGKGGTDVARDASDLVISDDNFATIVSGIEEGRIAYANVRNVINLLITQGAAEVLVVALGVLFGLPLPLLPVQLLWLNLVTNGIQDVALAFEPGMGNELRRRPRPPGEGIFNRLMVQRVLVGSSVIGVVGFAVYYWLIHAGYAVEAARNLLLLLMVLFENVHLGNCRSETVSALKLSPLRSPLLLFGALAALGIHLLMMFLPWGQTLLHTQAIDLKSFIVLAALSLSVFFAMEGHKWAWQHRKG